MARVLVGDDGRIRFWGVGHPSPYGVDDRAICGIARHVQHPCPEFGCGCGFYALDNLEAVRSMWPHSLQYPGFALLEVEVFGRVILHELGYRAERQRVLSAVIGDARRPLGCQECGGATCLAVPGVGSLCAAHALGRQARMYEVTMDDVRAALPTDWRLEIP